MAWSPPAKWWLFAPFHAVDRVPVARLRRGDAGHMGLCRISVRGVFRRWTTPAGHHGGVLLLMPGDPMRPRKVDPHFEPEAEAARQAGHRVAVVDHHALTSPGGTVAAVSGVPLIPKMRSGEGLPSDGEEVRDAVYRGWMLRASSTGTSPSRWPSVA